MLAFGAHFMQQLVDLEPLPVSLVEFPESRSWVSLAAIARKAATSAGWLRTGDRIAHRKEAHSTLAKMTGEPRGFESTLRGDKAAPRR